MGTGDQIQDAKEAKLLKRARKVREKLGDTLLSLDDHISDPRQPEQWYTEVRVKLPDDEDEDVMIIIKREGGLGKQIAFHFGVTAGLALQGLVGRLQNGSLKWKEDRPYERLNNK